MTLSDESGEESAAFENLLIVHSVLEVKAGRQFRLLDPPPESAAPNSCIGLPRSDGASFTIAAMAARPTV